MKGDLSPFKRAIARDKSEYPSIPTEKAPCLPGKRRAGALGQRGHSFTVLTLDHSE